MKTRLNKQLILETWSKFLQDVENASKNGTPGVPTFTDGIKKIKLDHNKVLQHAQDQKNYNDEHDIDPNEWNAARIAKQLHESEEVDASKEEDEAGIGTGFISGLAAAGIGAGILKRQQIKDGLINKTNTARAYMADKIHPEKQTK